LGNSFVHLKSIRVVHQLESLFQWKCCKDSASAAATFGRRTFTIFSCALRWFFCHATKWIVLFGTNCSSGYAAAWAEKRMMDKSWCQVHDRTIMMHTVKVVLWGHALIPGVTYY